MEPGYTIKTWDHCHLGVFRDSTGQMVGVAGTPDGAERLAEEHATVQVRPRMGLRLPDAETSEASVRSATGATVTRPLLAVPVMMRGRTEVYFRYVEGEGGPVNPHYVVRYGNGRVRSDHHGEQITLWEDVEDLIR